MSYLCDGVDDRLVGALAAAKAGAPLSISCWIKGVANTGAARVAAALAATDGVFDNSEYLNLTTAGFLQANTRTTSNANAQTLVAIPDSTWCHGLAVFATGSDRRIYLDGANKVTNTTNRTIAAVLDTIVLGSRADATAFFPGRVAELAIWDAILSDADAAALAAGDSPMSLATAPLRYYRLKTDALDINGANGLTVTGATVDADHPPVDDPPGSVVYQDLAGTVAGTGGPSADLQLVDPLAGTNAGTSTLTGQLDTVVPLAGQIDGSSAQTGNLATLDVLEGQIAGQSTLTGDLTLGAGATYKDLAGQIAGASTPTGDLQTIVPLAGAIAGTATQTATAQLTVLRALAGAIAGDAAIAGELTRLVALAGEIAGGSALEGNLLVGIDTGLPAYREGSLQGAHRAPTAPAYRRGS